MDITEIHSRISEMGKSAGSGLEENTKIIYTLLVTLNGSGLVASLAFIGTLLNSGLKNRYMPFYWSVIFFGIGITISFISLISNYFYFRMAVARYFKNYLNVHPSTIVDISGLLPVLVALQTPTKGQIVCSTLQKYLPLISTISFAIGLSFGVYYLNGLRVAFNG